MSVIKGLIFDLDGTLIDNYDRYLEYMLTCVGNDIGCTFTLSHARDLWYSIGAESRDAVIRSWGIDPDSFWTSFNKYESLDRKIENTFLYKDASFLAGLKLPKGIVTHTSLEHTTRLLEHVGMREHFHPIIACTEETGYKPSPLPLIYCVMDMKIKPEEAVYVGDTVSDMMAARHAGIKSVYINRFGRHINFVPDYEIDSLEKITEIVGICPELFASAGEKQ